MNNIIFELKNINKSFLKARSGVFEKKEYKKVLENVSLSLKRGEVMGIVGESGSGKSTLGRIATGLLKPDNGQVLYNGIDITSSAKDFKPYRKDIQMIFQNTYLSLDPNKTIGWLLKEALDINTGLSADEKKAQIDKMMELVGLRNVFKSRYPHELSGGERQRAAIALALMPLPKIIVADEAVSALDVSVSAQILNLMNDLKKEFDLSYIFISHDLAVVNYLSDTIAVMQDGRIVEFGTDDEIFKNAKSQYTKKLLEGTFIYDLPS